MYYISVGRNLAILSQFSNSGGCTLVTHASKGCSYPNVYLCLGRLLRSTSWFHSSAVGCLETDVSNTHG